MSVSANQKIAIMGLGYVGLTLSVALAKKGFKIYGIEAKKEIVAGLKVGKAHFSEKRLEALLRQQQKLGNLEILSSLPNEQIDTYIICVGTPLRKNQNVPNIDYIKDVTIDVAKHMQKGSLVVLRSTVPVGVSRNFVIPILAEYSKLKAGNDFLFVFAPERTIEGNAIPELENNPQIIGGLNETSKSVASDIFRKLTPSVIDVSSLEAAEMIKLLDNTYRDIRFAYANEIAMICEKLGLDATELINAANTHYPRNNIPVPSPGVGGACLSKDPYILIDIASKAGHEASLIATGRKINRTIISQAVLRIKNGLTEKDKDIQTSKIFLVGFAFKGEPETSDLRDSTSLWLLEELMKVTGAKNIYGYDPVVDSNVIRSLGINAVDSLDEGLSKSDAVLFLNNHRSYLDLDPSEICNKMNKPAIFYDAWRMFDKDAVNKIDGITYMGVGL